jgi:sugar/nucleoside kinase (ribokinase family)
MYDVLALGAAAVDELLYVDTYPPPDTKTIVLDAARQCGGLSATALVAAARLGARCAYAGTLGPAGEPDSEFVLSALAEDGVETQHCPRVDGGGPVRSVIVVGRTTGTRNIFPRQPAHTGAHAVLPPPEMIRAARVLLVDHLGIGGMLRAARIARDAGIAIVSDIERADDPRARTLLALVDHPVLSEEFAAAMTGETNPAMAARALWSPLRRAVVVTCGARGAWYTCDGDTCAHQPAFKVDAVDTTGCGDVFHGAYCAALAEGLPIDTRVRMAAAAAAIKATQPGAQLGAPTRAQLEAFLRSAPPTTQ